MLDTLFSAIQAQATEFLGQHNITDEQATQTLGQAHTSLFEGMKSQVLGGNLNGILDLLNGKAALAQSPVAAALITQYAGDLAEKVGLPAETAQAAASSIMGMAVAKFAEMNAEKPLDAPGLAAVIGEEVMENLRNTVSDAIGDLTSKVSGLFS